MHKSKDEKSNFLRRAGYYWHNQMLPVIIIDDLHAVSLTEALYYIFYEIPNRGLQPFVVENAHIQGLMPVF